MILHLDRDILTVGLEQVGLSGAEQSGVFIELQHCTTPVQQKTRDWWRERWWWCSSRYNVRCEPVHTTHNAQRTLDQAWLRHSACSGAEET